MDREGNDFLTFHLHNIKNESELSLVAVHTQLLNMGRKCSKNVSKNMRHKMQEEVKIGWIFSVVCMWRFRKDLPCWWKLKMCLDTDHFNKLSNLPSHIQAVFSLVRY